MTTVIRGGLYLAIAATVGFLGYGAWLDGQLPKNVKIVRSQCGQYTVEPIPRLGTFVLKNQVGGESIQVPNTVDIICDFAKNELRLLDSTMPIGKRVKSAQVFSLTHE